MDFLFGPPPPPAEARTKDKDKPRSQQPAYSLGLSSWFAPAGAASSRPRRGTKAGKPPKPDEDSWGAWAFGAPAPPATATSSRPRSSSTPRQQQQQQQQQPAPSSIWSGLFGSSSSSSSAPAPPGSPAKAKKASRPAYSFGLGAFFGAPPPPPPPAAQQAAAAVPNKARTAKSSKSKAVSFVDGGAPTDVAPPKPGGARGGSRKRDPAPRQAVSRAPTDIPYYKGGSGAAPQHRPPPRAVSRADTALSMSAMSQVSDDDDDDGPADRPWGSSADEKADDDLKDLARALRSGGPSSRAVSAGTDFSGISEDGAPLPWAGGGASRRGDSGASLASSAFSEVDDIPLGYSAVSFGGLSGWSEAQSDDEEDGITGTLRQHKRTSTSDKDKKKGRRWARWVCR